MVRALSSFPSVLFTRDPIRPISHASSTATHRLCADKDKGLGSVIRPCILNLCDTAAATAKLLDLVLSYMKFHYKNK